MVRTRGMTKDEEPNQPTTSIGVSYTHISKNSSNNSTNSASTAIIKAKKLALEAEHARRVATINREAATLEREAEEREFQAALAVLDAQSSRRSSRASSQRSIRHLASSHHTSQSRVDQWLENNVSSNLLPNVQPVALLSPEQCPCMEEGRDPPPMSATSAQAPVMQADTQLEHVAPACAAALEDLRLTASARSSALTPLSGPFSAAHRDVPKASNFQHTTTHFDNHATTGTQPRHTCNINKDCNENSQYPITQLAEAIKGMARYQPARRVSDFPLPSFSGTPTEWPTFYKYYERTKGYFGDLENLTRLSTALKGAARESVASLLVTVDRPELIIAALNRQFGIPELIVFQAIAGIRALPKLNVGTSARELNAFACKINNCVNTIQLLNLPEQMANPELVSAIIYKLTPLLKEKWVEFAFAKQNGKKFKLQLLSEFLLHEANIHLQFGVLMSDSLASENSISKKVDRVHTVTANAKPTYSIKGTTSTAATESITDPCEYCQNSSHCIVKCPQFLGLSMEERFKWVMNAKLCRKCLKKGRHRYKNCKVQCKVRGCKHRQHHTLLHGSFKEKSLDTDGGAKSEPEPSTSSQVNLKDFESATVTHVATPPCRHKPLLKVVGVTICGPTGKVDTFALLDDGSSATFIDSSVAKMIGAVGSQYQLDVKCIGGLTKVTTVEYVSFEIKGRSTNCQSHVIREARSIPNLGLARYTLHAENLNYDHLSDIPGLMTIEDAQPMIIIGIDNWHLMIASEVRKGTRSQPVACNTALGWVVFGFTSSRTKPVKFVTHDVYHVDAHEVSEPENLDALIKEYFTLDSIGIQKKSFQNSADERAVSILKQTTTRLSDGRFETGLPWIDNIQKVPNSFPLAKSRFHNLERKLLKDPFYAESYKANIQAMIDKNYAEPCLHPPTGITWYLPHFGVVHPQKRKLRVVHDAAAKCQGISLNSLLLSGPDLLQPLLGILMRFREGQVALNGDIREMFPQTKIRVEDRDAQRFLWRTNSCDPIREFRMSSMMFGAKSSPFTAIFLKNLNAEEHANQFPAASHAILHDHYMDDYLGSIDSADQAAQLAADIVHVHAQACLEMRSWVSNCKEALKLIPPDLRAPVSIPVELTANSSSSVKVLGVVWNPSDDTLRFLRSTPSVDISLTKRRVLSEVMRVYDPLGFLTPITIRGRILFQDIWRLGVDWDALLPERVLKRWEAWVRDLSTHYKCCIPRCYLIQPNPVVTHLHLFADASKDAYSCVAYWRFLFSDGSVKLALIGGKARLAPLKPTSIPRLELQAALIAARFAAYVTHEHRWKPANSFFWTDSLTVLKWLRGDARTFKTFVAYRIGEILELTNISCWKYVPTALNVADDATRAQSKYEITRWLLGPEFLLSDPSEWPQEPSSNEQLASEELLIREQVGHTSDIPLEPPLPVVADHSRFSRWLRLVRATARVRVCAKIFLVKLRKTKVDNPTIPNLPPLITASDIAIAERDLFRESQLQSFSEEIALTRLSAPLSKQSRLRDVALLLDEHGLLRLSGRISAVKNVPVQDLQPIVLDGRHPIIRLMISHFHSKFAHGNTELVVNEIRMKYHVLHLRPSVKSVASQCLFCRIRKAKPQIPDFGDLPQARLAHHTRPFTNVGLDYFGPVLVTSGRRHLKRWVALFTCLTVRAVHLEIVENLTTDSALMALRRLIARRGCPSTIYSDNGTAFVGAARKLPELYNFASDNKIDWIFIPPAAPFMGGCWERLVRSIKTALSATLKERAPREEILFTLLLEAEAVVNSRPLTHVPADINEEEALTPFHFLLGGPQDERPLKEVCDADLCRRQDYKKGLRLADHFWQRWTKEILPCLVPRKTTGSTHQFKVGDLVLVVDGSLPRASWPRGRVSRVFPGPDGRVRIVELVTKAGSLKRATRLLVPLIST